jgi:hypothetical protein
VSSKPSPAEPPASKFPAPADAIVFYSALGVRVRARQARWAPVRCFLPGHDDRHASSGVNLETGQFRCHGCGAHGGAYHAALALGYTRRDAAELAKRFGLWVEG